MFCTYFCCRPAPSCCGCSPQTAADTTEWMNLPAATFPPASCRYTHGETFHSESIKVPVDIHIIFWVADAVCAPQDGCYSEGADQLGEGGVPRGQEKGDALQL